MKIILDCCNNHLGIKELRDEMIDIAAKNNIYAIKFQLYNSIELNPNYPNYDNLYSKLCRYNLTYDDVVDILNRCVDKKIVPMFTIFSPSVINKLHDAWQVSNCDNILLKIASPDYLNYSLIEKVVEKFYGLDIFISTGMHEFEDVTKIKDVMDKYKKLYKSFKYFYCVSKYPTPKEDIDLSHLSDFDGFSDHTLGIEVAKKILDLEIGIEYIEKHFTLGKALPGKDQSMSIDPIEVEQLKFHIDYLESCKNYKRRWVYDREQNRE